MDEKEAEARPVMGTIFLVYTYIYHAKSRLNTPVWGSLRSPNYVVDMSYVVCRMSVVCQINCVGGIT